MTHDRYVRPRDHPVTDGVTEQRQWKIPGTCLCPIIPIVDIALSTVKEPRASTIIRRERGTELDNLADLVSTRIAELEKEAVDKGGVDIGLSKCLATPRY